MSHRSFSRKYYNWSSIRQLLQLRFYEGYWIIIIIPIAFSFLHEIATLVEQFKTIPNEILSIFIKLNQGIDNGMGSVDQSLNSVTSTPFNVTKWNEWEQSMRYLFFGALFQFAANICHRWSSSIVQRSDRREFIKAEGIDASSGNSAYRILRENEALERITDYEKHFSEEFDNLGNILDYQEEEFRLHTIEAGATAYYDMLCTKRLLLLYLTTIFYLFGFLLTGIVLFLRTIVVLKGIT